MSDPPASLRVLHVDGDRSFSTALREALDAADGRFDVEWVPDPDAGIDTLAAEEFDGVVTAYGFEADTATRFLNRARAAGHELPFVVFHDDESGRAAVDAVAADGAVALPKGTDDRRVAVLAEAIREAVDEGSTAAEPGGRPGADRFAAAFEALPYPAAHVEIRAEANVVRGVNSAFERVFGYEAADVAGRSINELIVPPEGIETARAIDERVADGRLVEAELERSTSDGAREFLFRAQGFDAGEGPPEALGVYVDVTDRKRRERELSRFARIIEAAGDPVYTLDSEGTFTYVNRQLGALTGHEPEALVGESVSSIMDESDVRRGTELIRDLLDDSDRNRGTLRMHVETVDGARVPTENHIALLPRESADEPFAGTVGVMRDVSERVERERRLEEQNERLDAFSSVVGHDLRNPLNVAQGHLGIARDADDDGRRAESFDAVARSLERMEGLIDGLLTLARDGEAVSDPTPVSLARVAEACRPMARTMGGRIDVDAEGVVLADRNRLRQLVENLVRNATEHSDDGVVVRVVDTPDGFAVTDDGPGIPPEDREAVFDAGYSTNADGTGLGLSIVADIAEAHGWDLTVTECERGGARFEVADVDRPDDHGADGTDGTVC